MKRILFINLAILFGLLAHAQTEFDALKYVQPDIQGTARYTSMAGAFGALGGDPSAFRDNPAGLGIYRKSEFATTVDFNMQNSKSAWMSGNTVNDNFYKFGFNQFSYVISVPSYKSSSSLKYSNFGISYNRLKNLNRSVRLNGGTGATSSLTDYVAYFTGDIDPYDIYEDDSYNPYNNLSVPWISALFANSGLVKGFVDSEGYFWNSLLLEEETVAPTYKLRERGYLQEYAFSWSGNFNNKFFFGASFNIHDLNYSLKSDYHETFSSDGGYLNLINTFESTGTGVGLKLGGIYVPLDYLRLGASMQTPIFYNIKDYFYADLKSGFMTDTDGFINQSDGTPSGNSTYKISGPFAYNASAAFILGNKGLISVEYAGLSNSHVKFRDEFSDSYDYSLENDSVHALFNTSHTVKIGGEYRITNSFALRAGTAFMNQPVQSRINKEFYPNTVRTDVDYLVQEGLTTYFTGGFGYRQTHWYIDFAVMHKSYQSKFYPYNRELINPGTNYEPAKILTRDINLVATVGFRF